MKNNVKNLIIIAVVIVVVAGIIILLKNRQSQMTLFYSDTCPHCKILEQYIVDNNVKERFNFEELEISNTNNVFLLERRYRECNLDTSQGIGVPFFWDGQKCLMGTDEIINYFTK